MAQEDIWKAFFEGLSPVHRFAWKIRLRRMLLFCEIDKDLDQSCFLSNLKGLSPKVRMALRFLEQNFCKGAALKEAAEHVKMHPTALCKKIHEELTEHKVYITTCEYLSGLRIRKAIELIRSDQLILFKEVAEQVGIGAQDFRRVFKKYTGMTPTAYRTTLAEKEASLV